MATIANTEPPLAEKKLSRKAEELKIKILAPAEDRRHGDEICRRYKKAFDLLRDK